MNNDLYFCLVGFDLGFLLSGDLKKEANYMTDDDFVWVKVKPSQLIKSDHRFGVVIRDKQNENAWTLVETRENRNDAMDRVQSLQNQGTHAMEINLVQS